eukprot:1147091-Pelagomonas_calceolata.AAC.2
MAMAISGSPQGLRVLITHQSVMTWPFQENLSQPTCPSPPGPTPPITVMHSCSKLILAQHCKRKECRLCMSARMLKKGTGGSAVKVGKPPTYPVLFNSTSNV